MQDRRLRISLFILRLTVFIVMLMWTLDKFIRPEHAAHVYKVFYGIGSFETVLMYLIGAVELIILTGFIIGFLKTFTYGIVMVVHGISTLSSYEQYLAPYAEGPNLLFFAAWPMLAACIGLFLLRKRDTLLALGGRSDEDSAEGNERGGD